VKEATDVPFKATVFSGFYMKPKRTRTGSEVQDIAEFSCKSIVCCFKRSCGDCLSLFT